MGRIYLLKVEGEAKPQRYRLGLVMRHYWFALSVVGLVLGIYLLITSIADHSSAAIGWGIILVLFAVPTFCFNVWIMRKIWTQRRQAGQ